jgi:type VI secretion system secreted protein Hcp
MATVDYFLKIDGIEGESADSKHKGEIQLESWSLGATNAGSHSAGGGGGAGKVHMQDIFFTKKVDKATPKLILACATGEHIKKAVLTCRKAGKDAQEFLKYTFSELLVSSWQLGGNPTDVIPHESFSLNYTKVEVEYKEQKPDGTLGAGVKAGFDLKIHKAT